MTSLPNPTPAELVQVLREFADERWQGAHDCGCRFCRATRIVRAWDEHHPAPDVSDVAERVR